MEGIYDSFMCSFAIIIPCSITLQQEVAGCCRRKKPEDRGDALLPDREKKSQMIRKHFWPQLILYNCIESEK